MGGVNPYIKPAEVKKPTRKYTITFLPEGKTFTVDPSVVRYGHNGLELSVLDIAEGADIIMVKPALAYLDVIRQVRDHSNLPLAAYNVSGEFAMIKAAAQNGWIDERGVVMEVLTGIRRAGAREGAAGHRDSR